MCRLYAGLAWIIAGAVVVQAAAIAFAFGGMLNHVSEAASSTRPCSRAAGPAVRASSASGSTESWARASSRCSRRTPRRLVLRARAGRAPLGRNHPRTGRTAGDARLLDHRHALPGPHPRCERARDRGRRGDRGASRATVAAVTAGPTVEREPRGGDVRCRRGVISRGAPSSASRSRPRSAPARSRGVPRCSASTR